MTQEEEIQESERLRKGLNDHYKLIFNCTHDMHPFFTQKPAFYYHMKQIFNKEEK